MLAEELSRWVRLGGLVSREEGGLGKVRRKRSQRRVHVGVGVWLGDLIIIGDMEDVIEKDDNAGL